MKQITAALSSMLLVGGVNAASDVEVYHGWATGNPDLSTETPTTQFVSGAQPGIGDDFGHYGSWGAGNPELYLDIGDEPSGNSRFPDIYGSFPEP